MRLAAILFLLLMPSGAEAAPQPSALQPSGVWKLDYADSSCVLSRPFSSGGQTYEFQLTLEPVDTSAWLRIGSGDKTGKRDDGDAAVEIDGKPLPRPVHFNIFANAAGGTTREFLFENFRDEVGATSKSLRLRPQGYGDFTFAAADFPDAMHALDSCMDDLHRSLGIDPAVVRSVATKPDGWSLEFVKSPNREFDMQLLYWVAPDGRVDECRVLGASGIAEFDARVCDELKKNGRFKPARNAAGAPMRAPVYENLRIRTEVRESSSPL